MKMKKAIVAISVLVILLFISSCGEPEPEGVCPASCDDGNPCTSDSCSKETSFMCRNTQIPGCDPVCGAPCTGSAGKYMTMQCDKKAEKCAADVSPSTKVTPTPILLEQASRGVNFRVNLLMNQPFNMQRDLIEVKISTPSLPSGVSSVKIKRVELTGQTPARQTLILGSKDVNKEIYGTSALISEDMRIDFPTADFDGEYSNIKVTVFFEYDQIILGGTTEIEGQLPVTVRAQTFKWFKPTVSPECPASCDDSNPATDDVCSAQTGYFCEHRPKAGECGNYVCESIEDRCTCPEDCGPCLGDASPSLSYECSSDNKCVAVLKPGLIQEPVSTFDDRNLNVFYLQNTYSYNNPFNVKTDKFSMEFTLFNLGATTQDVKISSVKILERDKALASADPQRAFTGVGDSFTIEMPVTFAGLEEDKTLSVKVWYEYNLLISNQTIPKSGSYSKSLGKITLIGPTG